MNKRPEHSVFFFKNEKVWIKLANYGKMEGINYSNCYN